MQTRRYVAATALSLLTLAVLVPSATAGEPRALPSDGPVPAPVAAIDPSTDLLDAQIVTITASGFLPQETVVVEECPAGTSDPTQGCDNLATAVSDTDGNISASYRLDAIVDLVRPDSGAAGTAGETVVDCRVAACELWFVAIDDSSRETAVALAFDPDGPLRPEMTLTVTPHDDLVDGQAVRLHGTGFSPDGPVEVIQCAFYGHVGGGCDADTAVDLTANHDGEFDVTFVVRVSMHASFPEGDYDCRERIGCIMAATDLLATPINGGRGLMLADLTFTPAPAPPVVADPIPVAPRFTG